MSGGTEQPACPTGKQRYPDKKTAGAALIRLKGSGHGERSRYWCLACGGWHLTSKPARKQGS